MHPDVRMGLLILSSVACLLLVTSAGAISRREYRWYREGAVSLIVLTVCFVIVFPLIFGYHPR